MEAGIMLMRLKKASENSKNNKQTMQLPGKTSLRYNFRLIYVLISINVLKTRF